MSLPNAIKRTVTRSLQEKNCISDNEVIEHVRSIGGGDVSDAFLCKTNAGKKIFVKTCSTSSGQTLDDIVNMFKSEEVGLGALANTHTIRVPVPYVHGVIEGESCGYLATEFIAMGGKSGKDLQRKFGEQLADLHLAPGPDRFGFPVNNTIGSTPQDNTWTSDYLEFLRRRLTYQFELASSRHPQIQQLGQALLDRLPSYFEGIEPIRPSLQHGDLWSGNWSADEEGKPVIFDPATFYGHSESDLGIMRLFGGVDADFYKAYHEKIPKTPGYEKRVCIYTLYHAVNHLNMFGSSYLGTCRSLFSEILGD